MTTIVIKYSLEGNIAKYPNFIEIQQLSDYDSIVYINCSNNRLTSLPQNLPESLQKLYCSYCPLLTSIPEEFGRNVVTDQHEGSKSPEIKGLQELSCYKCPWLKPSKEKLDKIIILQNYFKNTLMKACFKAPATHYF